MHCILTPKICPYSPESSREADVDAAAAAATAEEGAGGSDLCQTENGKNSLTRLLPVGQNQEIYCAIAVGLCPQTGPCIILIIFLL